MRGERGYNTARGDNMDTRESVLRALIEGGGEFISGEALADRLNVSRAAVWKAIRALKAEGRKIGVILY